MGHTWLCIVRGRHPIGVRIVFVCLFIRLDRRRVVLLIKQKPVFIVLALFVIDQSSLATGDEIRNNDLDRIRTVSSVTWNAFRYSIQENTRWIQISEDFDGGYVLLKYVRSGGAWLEKAFDGPAVRD